MGARLARASEKRTRAGRAVELPRPLRYDEIALRAASPAAPNAYPMRIHELIPHLDAVDVRGDAQRTFARVTRDSREAGDDAVFVAIRGGHLDGHDRIANLRAAAVIVDRDVDAPAGTVVIRVRDTRRALAFASAAIHGFPGRALRVVGVTGTKGKTTTTALIEGALLHAGRIAGRIGTTGTMIAGQALPSQLTTPDSPELQALLAVMRDRGATDVAMEVSSIGVVQERVAAIGFHFALFTNLGRDHLDFHGTMDAYAAAKSRLFSDLLRPIGGMPRAALNIDDPASTSMHPPTDSWTYGFGDAADLRISAFQMSGDGLSFELTTPFGAMAVRSPLVGRHNAYNLAGAAAACLAAGLTVEQTAAGLASVAGVPGRLEGVANDRGILVVVDYAHTPKSLEAVLVALREVGDARLWCVFGCGGDRDPGKRPIMGSVAERLADRVVVTSDNPRSEPPQAILDQIVAGMVRPPALTEVDRRAAIRWALDRAESGDVVLIAGKGHETYQEIAGEKHPFDDRIVAREALGGGAP